MTGFLSYVLQIMNSLMMISNVFLMLTRSLASARRISEIFEEELDLADGDAFASIEHGDIEFRNVSFKYNPKAKQNTLSKINIKIKAGETIGIIGGTGSGKSSLVQLIPRLYDVNEGEVLIDGKNVKEYSLKHLRGMQSEWSYRRMYCFPARLKKIYYGEILKPLMKSLHRASHVALRWMSLSITFHIVMKRI